MAAAGAANTLASLSKMKCIREEYKNSIARKIIGCDLPAALRLELWALFLSSNGGAHVKFDGSNTDAKALATEMVSVFIEQAHFETDNKLLVVTAYPLANILSQVPHCEYDLLEPILKQITLPLHKLSADVSNTRDYFINIRFR
jgi:hypothetical protein